MPKKDPRDKELVDRVVTHKSFFYFDADGDSMEAQVGETIKVSRHAARTFSDRLVDPKVSKAVKAAEKAVEASNAPEPTPTPEAPKPSPSAKAPTAAGPST